MLLSSVGVWCRLKNKDSSSLRDATGRRREVVENVSVSAYRDNLADYSLCGRLGRRSVGAFEVTKGSLGSDASQCCVTLEAEVSDRSDFTELICL